MGCITNKIINYFTLVSNNKMSCVPVPYLCSKKGSDNNKTCAGRDPYKSFFYILGGHNTSRIEMFMAALLASLVGQPFSKETNNTNITMYM